MDGTPIEYKGWGLTPIVSRTPEAFNVLLLVEKPNGIRRAMGPLGKFASATVACSFAIEYGKALVDGRPLPTQTVGG
ncbi:MULTISPECIES: hypothetical protein [Caballeronia]|jgi:hypothetical protein|uniref:Uncharacterized protein n=1 Tax=Caballeronia telluris TaxID=326475 RepID=A0A158KAA6_9BURK|nr:MULTISPECIES: hypothetical protein [Caballeronia]MDR5754041.1 hypothetical protein [Caballeronia sp. LZ024]MDR5840420.1 hypothetical protein [Caballeronia sp. LZ031]SAL77719.1 hypothetical protein AWB66_05689 [Caballeronia telluris]